MPTLRIEAGRVEPPGPKLVGGIAWCGRLPWLQVVGYLVRFSWEFMKYARGDRPTSSEEGAGE